MFAGDTCMEAIIHIFSRLGIMIWLHDLQPLAKE